MEAARTKSEHAGLNILYGMPEGQDARALADRARAAMPDDRVALHVALDEMRLAALAELLAFFAPDVQVIQFPAWDCLPYDRVSPNSEISAQRVAALSGLLAWRNEKKRYPRILLTTINAITQRVAPRDVIADAALTAVKGGALPVPKLQAFLAANGYARTDTVREAGEYAIRGGIVDLFPSGYEHPIRLDLFGDEIESIRSFDPGTQRTDKKLDGFELHPATEFLLTTESIARFRSGYRALFGMARDDDPLYAAVSEGRRYNGMDHWLPLFYDRLETLFDYVPDADITIDQHGFQSAEERFTHILDFYQARKTLEKAGMVRKKESDVSLSGTVYHPVPPEQLYLTSEEWNMRADGASELSPFAPAQGEKDGGGRRGRDFGDVRAQNGDVFAALSEYVSAHRMDRRKILVAAYSEGARDRLGGMMQHAGFGNIVPIDAAEHLKKLQPHQTGMAIVALEHGFTAPDLIVLTEQDILGDRLARRQKRRKKADNFLSEVSALSPGDLVVHNDHGIGRFVSLETLRVGKTVHDCLKIEYAGNDRLYVPVENIEVLSRFGSDEGMASLDRLGGAGWQARKARIKADLMRMADGLLHIAAQRHLRQGEKMEVGHEIYNEFVARFPYQETDDQLRAIGNVVDDLARGEPMDRLVCGDVGFGKTEVALRAAYVAAMNGAQVAVVVPTTLLARQHYHNFTQRFSQTGLRVEQLSRMVTAKDATLTRDGLQDGGVSIVVGTHAILGKGVKFKNLGLVVVDEEQRFGVKQKEKLKELKHNVHVLTLTATPIPRTLQMALTGVRDMSVIATPPVDRLAIRTFVLPYDPVVIREALLREHYRGGQSFYVCPRVRDIEEVKRLLAELVPEVKVIEAHGQMARRTWKTA